MLRMLYPHNSICIMTTEMPSKSYKQLHPHIIQVGKTTSLFLLHFSMFNVFDKAYFAVSTTILFHSLKCIEGNTFALVWRNKVAVKRAKGGGW